MRTIDEKDQDEMLDRAGEEICNYINFLDPDEGREMAHRIFDIWDQAYQAFDCYEDYIDAVHGN